MPLVLDGLTQDRWRRKALTEAERERRQRVLADNIRNAEITVAVDSGRDVSSLVDQLGNYMPAIEFIRRLQLCNRRLEFVKHPSEDLYGIYIRKEGQRIHICGMPSIVVPEFTVIEKMKMKVPQRDLLDGKPKDHIEWEEIETVKQILLQGWRTILLRLLNARVISEYHVRKHFTWNPSRESKKWSEAVR